MWLRRYLFYLVLSSIVSILLVSLAQFVMRHHEGKRSAALLSLRADLEPKLALLAPLDSTEKIEQIALYLYHHMDSYQEWQTTRPSNGLDEWPYVAWPNGAVRAYVALANTFDLPSRLVQKGEQVLAETFVTEQNRWALLDLSCRRLYFEDQEGRVLCEKDLRLALQEDRFHTVTSARFEEGTIVYAREEGSYRPFANIAAIDHEGSTKGT